MGLSLPKTKDEQEMAVALLEQSQKGSHRNHLAVAWQSSLTAEHVIPKLQIRKLQEASGLKLVSASDY